MEPASNGDGAVVIVPRQEIIPVCLRDSPSKSCQVPHGSLDMFRSKSGSLYVHYLISREFSEKTLYDGVGVVRSMVGSLTVASRLRRRAAC